MSFMLWSLLKELDKVHTLSDTALSYTVTYLSNVKVDREKFEWQIFILATKNWRYGTPGLFLLQLSQSFTF